MRTQTCRGRYSHTQTNKTMRRLMYCIASVNLVTNRLPFSSTYLSSYRWQFVTVLANVSWVKKIIVYKKYIFFRDGSALECNFSTYIQIPKTFCILTKLAFSRKVGMVTMNYLFLFSDVGSGTISSSWSIPIGLVPFPVVDISWNNLPCVLGIIMSPVPLNERYHTRKKCGSRLWCAQASEVWLYILLSPALTLSVCVCCV